MSLSAQLGMTADAARKNLVKRYSVLEFAELSSTQAIDLETRLTGQVVDAVKRRDAQAAAAGAYGLPATPATARATAPEANGSPSPVQPVVPSAGTNGHSVLSTDQLNTLKDCYRRLTEEYGMPPGKWKELLAQYKAESAASLTPADAAALTDRCIKRLADLSTQQAASLKAESAAQDAAEVAAKKKGGPTRAVHTAGVIPF